LFGFTTILSGLSLSRRTSTLDAERRQVRSLVATATATATSVATGGSFFAEGGVLA
jgi:hypothetical protein